MNTTIIDLNIGNYRSIAYKLELRKISAIISNKKEDIENADKLILPGVGHFKAAMDELKRLDLINILNEKVVDGKTPVMGICLGMQLMCKKSEEGNVEGLGWVNANVKQFKFDEIKLPVPHVGWNSIIPKKKSKYLDDDLSERLFYFTHSYYLECEVHDEILATTEYGIEFTSMIEKENIFGSQFHPEKSHKGGFRLIENFILK